MRAAGDAIAARVRVDLPLSHAGVVDAAEWPDRVSDLRRGPGGAGPPDGAAMR